MKVSPNMVKGIYLSLLGRGFPTHLDDFSKIHAKIYAKRFAKTSSKI